MKDNLDETSRRVRLTYYLERQLFMQRVRGTADESLNEHGTKKWDGGIDSRGVSHKPIWPKIVKYAVTQNCDPEQLVRSVFRVWKGIQPPLPTMTMTEEAVKACRSFKTENYEFLKHKLEAFQREAEQAFMLKSMARPDELPTKLWREVIVSPTISAGALFRYCLAISTCQSDLARMALDNALTEFVANPEEYAKLLGDQLPDSFYRQANQRIKELFK